MKSIPLEKFASPDFLQGIQPKILLGFLKLYEDYFRGEDAFNKRKEIYGIWNPQK